MGALKYKICNLNCLTYFRDYPWQYLLHGEIDLFLKKRLTVIDGVVFISPKAVCWEECTLHPLNLNFHVWYEAEIYIRNNPWQKMMIDDLATLVTWLLHIYRPIIISGKIEKLRHWLTSAKGKYWWNV